MFFRQLATTEASLSYFFGCATVGKAVAVDVVAGDEQWFLDQAKGANVRITYVIDTHVHADHYSGGRKLAGLAGAPYCLHESNRGKVDYDFLPLADGQVLDAGNVKVKVLHTPGHTPDSICLLVTDLRRGEAPWFVVTGDTLFVGAVGRPDLLGRETEMAAQLHETLHEKLLSLPDEIEIFPGHQAGSACGVGLSGKPSSTLGFEKRWNPLLSKATRRVRDGGARSSTEARGDGADAARQLRPDGVAAMTEAVIRLGLRENLPQFALLVVVNAFVGRDGGPRAQHPAGDRRAGIPCRCACGDPVVHRRFRHHQSPDQLWRRTVCRSLRAQARPRRRLAGRDSGAVPADVGTGLVVDRGGQRAAGRQPGAHLVDDGDHEDRPRRADAARARDGRQRVRRLCSRRRERLRHRLDRRALRPAAATVLSRHRVRDAGTPALRAMVRETKHHVAHESNLRAAEAPERPLSQREVFWRTSLTDRNLSSVSQAGLVNNLNDGMAWGIFPLYFAAAGIGLERIGILAGLYPAVWGIMQLFTGAWSDRIGRKRLIVGGMWVQAAGIGVTTATSSFAMFAVGAVLLGAGTAMVYPTLLAAIGDVAHPRWRASAVGVYRLWRDLGYAIGALLAGIVADAFGLAAAMWLVAVVTFGSGMVAALRMSETLPVRHHRSAR